MKKSIAIVVLMGMAFGRAQADLGKGSKLLAVNLGVNLPLTELDLTGVGGGKEKLGGPGVSGGAQFIYHLSQRVGIGGEINLSLPSERTSIGKRSVSKSVS